MRKIDMTFPPPPEEALEGTITEVISRDDGIYYRVKMDDGTEKIVKEDRILKKIEEN
jgi:hypothetical protein